MYIRDPGRSEVVAWDKAVPASSSLKLLHLGPVDGHLAAQSILVQRYALVTFPIAVKKY